MTSHDRCDRCGAQAYVRLRELIDLEPLGRDLLFCAHHHREHSPALDGRFAIVEDDRATLHETVRQPEPA